MPELPEVETTKRGLQPHLEGHTVVQVRVHQGSLRWPVPEALGTYLAQQTLNTIERRAKYLLFRFDAGTLIAHLGMSGSLRIVDSSCERKKHDHIDIAFNNHKIMRYNDPRRFGAILWTDQPPATHKLLRELGPEPLSDAFDHHHLSNCAKKRSITIKQLIMDQKAVVGVGNIYATEALFMSKIHPMRPANTLKPAQAKRLVNAIQEILHKAIKMGGTTLRDFVNSEGKPGYFKQSLLVYGRDGQPCAQCEQPLSLIKINNRSTVYCDYCQK